MLRPAARGATGTGGTAMVPLAYSRGGNGEPLVLLHPLGSDRRVWEPVLPRLARHFEVIALDLPGFGDSPALPERTEATPAARPRLRPHGVRRPARRAA